MAIFINELLTACCDPQPGGRHSDPFRVGDHVYACDGRIIVRTALPVSVDVADKPASGIDVSTLPWDGTGAPEVDWPADMPAFPDLGDVGCRRCWGRRERECDMGHHHTCDVCEGTGKGPPTVRLKPVKVGPSWMNPISAVLLRAVGVKARPFAGADPQRGDGVKYGFAGYGFEGLCVGVNENSEFTDVLKMRLVRAVEEAVARPLASAFV